MQKIALAVVIPTLPASLEIVRSPVAEGPIQARVPNSSGGITPEIMTVIETAVTAYAGKNARIVSVKLVDETPAGSNSWVDQGLALVHASHNTVQRGH